MVKETVTLQDYTSIFFSTNLKKTLAFKIVNHCSTNIILELGRTIKFLLLDHSKGVNTELKVGKKKCEIKIHIEKENLLV